MSRARKQDAFLRKQVADLTAEVKRKERLAMQAIAARGQFKEALNEKQQRLNNFQAVVDQIKIEKEEANAERDRYERKHDEMFTAVSGLNSRIEELEQHKLHLLQKLKTYGDKGDLSYIIKTQKLEDVKGKNFSLESAMQENAASPVGGSGGEQQIEGHQDGSGDKSAGNVERGGEI